MKVTVDRAVLEQALEAMLLGVKPSDRGPLFIDAITTLRQALMQASACGEAEQPVRGLQDVHDAIMADPSIAEPVQAEPVLYIHPETFAMNSAHVGAWKPGHELEGYIPLYTAPRRTWVGLTDVEWMNIVNKNQAWFGMHPDEVAHEVCKLTEAKLKEKNNG